MKRLMMIAVAGLLLSAFMGCNEVEKCSEGDEEACASLAKALENMKKGKSSEKNVTNKLSEQENKLTDSRDGKTYKTVKIGNQTWMAENLNYNAPKSKCSEDKEKNCKKYGRLYTERKWKNLCPSGWHVPTVKEWNKLFKSAGATRKCRDFGYDDGTGDNDCDYIDWLSARDKLNRLGFDIRMGGNGWGNIGKEAHFATNGRTHRGDIIYCFFSDYPNASDLCNQDYAEFFSVRCIKNTK